MEIITGLVIIGAVIFWFSWNNYQSRLKNNATIQRAAILSKINASPDYITLDTDFGLVSETDHYNALKNKVSPITLYSVPIQLLFTETEKNQIFVWTAN